MPSVRTPKYDSTKSITIKRVGFQEYDIEVPHLKEDWHMRYENGAWIMDIFDCSVKNADNAYVTTKILQTSRSVNWDEIHRMANL